MVGLTKIVFVRCMLLGSAFAVAGCGGGGSATPLTAGPIQTITALESSLTQFNTPLAPGQSVTVSYDERSCRYQQYTSDLARGQYATLGCDGPVVPPTLTVTVQPMRSGQPCALSYTRPSPGTVVFTKTGLGDPASNAPPNFYCTGNVTDPRLSPTYNSAVFYL